MTLSDYYKSLETEIISPRKQLRNKIIQECGVTETTVFRWLSGEYKPCKPHRAIISKLTGISEIELFGNE